MDAIRRGLTLLVCAVVLAACQEDGPGAVSAADTRPDILVDAERDCLRKGGRWGMSPGNAGFVCYRNLSDAGKFCSAASDCKGLCLARSRTCSPIEPFYGCHEVLSNTGVRQTLCIQ